MEKKKKPTLVIILGVILLILIAGGVYVLANWNRSLGEPLGLPTKTSGPGNLSQAGGSTRQSPSQAEGTGTAQSNLPTTLPSPQGEPVCGGPRLMYLLAAGVDSTDPQYLYGLSDVIRVVRIDFVTPKVTVLSLPRDLEVQIPDLIPSVRDQITNAKLNQAYFLWRARHGVL